MIGLVPLGELAAQRLYFGFGALGGPGWASRQARKGNEDQR